MSGHGCWRKRKEERKKRELISINNTTVSLSWNELLLLISKLWKVEPKDQVDSRRILVCVKCMQKEKFTSAKIGYNCSIHNPIILGRKALKDAAGSCTNSCRIFRNLLMTREPAVLSWCSISDNCWRVKVWSSGWTICSVTAGPSWTFKFSNNASRKPRISSVVSVTWVNIYVLMVDI